MNHSLIYDIRTSENALSTLVNFTGVVPPIWEKYIQLRSNYRYDEDLVEDVISKHGHFPTNYETWMFVYFHITTSANKCQSFKTHGIFDLKKSYLCPDSELRQFLDDKGVVIDIDAHSLNYRGQAYDNIIRKIPFRFRYKGSCVLVYWEKVLLRLYHLWVLVCLGQQPVWWIRPLPS